MKFELFESFNIDFSKTESVSACAKLLYLENF